MSKLAKALTAAAGNAGGEALYVEDVFSTYLYTGNGSTQTITTGIDLDGEGGLLWIKRRSGIGTHTLVDSINNSNGRYYLATNLTNGLLDTGTSSYPLSSTGFSLNNGGTQTNGSGETYASWTFRKAPKFFDVVTYTGDGTAGREIAHNLGSAPACIIVKRTDSSYPWIVYHTSIGNDKILQLDSTAATQAYDNWYSTDPTSSVFTINSYGSMNASGGTYVAYLFASDAGGFGDDDESIIKCGSYTGNNSADGPTVTLGFEPQWVLIKESSAAGNAWSLYDMMRNGTMDQHLRPNSSDAEATAAASPEVLPQATGFKLNTSSGRVNRSQTYIYIAIRRPMKTPESGTEVFSANESSGSAGTQITTNFAADWMLAKYLSGTGNTDVNTRLTGFANTDSDFVQTLRTNLTDAEATANDWANTVWNTGFKLGSTYAGLSTIYYSFKRATGFFDVVAYTGGTGSPYGQYNHSLGVAPELMIVKKRSGVGTWYVYAESEGATKEAQLTSSSSFYTGSSWQNITPTATKFAVNTSSTNDTGATYIAYLFATLAGVSKVGSYTGTAADLNVDCGFSAGARFILIKRTDSTGDWYVWDSERGIVAGNDPYLLLNSTAAEVTSTDYIDPLSSGFTVTSSAPAALNASGGTYIYLAIA